MISKACDVTIILYIERAFSHSTLVSIAYDSTTEEVTAPYHSRFMKFNSLIASSKPEYLIDTGAKVSEVWVECS